MIIGFTGTQTGMIDDQKIRLRGILLYYDPTEFHHGDCIGADKEAHLICKDTPTKIIIHPPIDSKKRAFCKNAYEILEEKEYIKRNHDMVNVCDLLIACPSTAHEVTRSGTWATVRYARKTETNYLIINPNGEMSHIKF